MKEFYYQIKGKNNPEDPYSYGKWQFPPIWSDKVSAKNKKEAKKKIDEEYGRVFPLRVLTKDLDSAEFLLSIKEIKKDDHHTKRLFEVHECKQCGKEFKVIEKYQQNSNYKGPVYCSDECKATGYELERMQNHEDWQTSEFLIKRNRLPVIYKITNKATGKSYVGKTTQIFTFRWYQHFFCSTGTKFHEEIKNTQLTDWKFEILEQIDLPIQIKDMGTCNKFILERERKWINELNTIKEGYNSI